MTLSVAFRPRQTVESGFAMLLLVCLTALVLIAAATIVPDAMLNVRREREKEMIWRGQQYARGVKLYYRKMGRFPTSIDDLTKPTTGSLRFMRQAYKDPMNKADGSWRLIYVGPAGQLIGSLKPHPLIDLAASGRAPAGTASSNGSSQGAAAGKDGQSKGKASGDNSGGDGDQAESADQPTSNDDMSSSPSGLFSDDSTIIGGNIIGVGSKVNQKSVMAYDKAKNYRQFEFIWDPSKDTIGIGGMPGSQMGNPTNGSSFGNNPFGQQPPQSTPPGSGTSPQQ
jgi:type II secretory pathway pseudopilin PulG